MSWIAGHAARPLLAILRFVCWPETLHVVRRALKNHVALGDTESLGRWLCARSTARGNRAPGLPCKTPRSPRRTPSCQASLVAVSLAAVSLAASFLAAVNVSLGDFCYFAHRNNADCRPRPLRGHPSSARRSHRRWLSCHRNSCSPPSVRLVDVRLFYYTRQVVEPPRRLRFPHGHEQQVVEALQLFRRLEPNLAFISDGSN